MAPRDPHLSHARDEAGLETALARNRAFAAAGGHRRATALPTLRLLALTCLDPRVGPAHVLGLATVASDVDRLRSAEAISSRVTVSGHVYDVVTGLVETVVPARSADNRTHGRRTAPLPGGADRETLARRIRGLGGRV
jgi:carbonic anhydrase